MKQNPLPNKIHRSSIRNKKLTMLTEWRLQHRGKMDCRQQILRKGPDGIYMSPFIKQEISLCSINIQKELEIHEKILSTLNTEMEKEQLMLDQKARILNGIDLNHDSLENVTPIRLRGEETLNDDIIKLYRTSEAKARLSAKKKQIETLDMSMNVSLKQKQQYKLIIEKECAVTSLRCNQLYEILCMRLSAYWAGALKDTKYSQEIPPVYTIDNFVEEMKLQFCFNNGEE